MGWGIDFGPLLADGQQGVASMGGGGTPKVWSSLNHLELNLNCFQCVCAGQRRTRCTCRVRPSAIDNDYDKYMRPSRLRRARPKTAVHPQKASRLETTRPQQHQQWYEGARIKASFYWRPGYMNSKQQISSCRSLPFQSLRTTWHVKIFPSLQLRAVCTIQQEWWRQILQRTAEPRTTLHRSRFPEACVTFLNVSFYKLHLCSSV